MKQSNLELHAATRIKQLGLPDPIAEYRFTGLSGTRKWLFDFAWPDHGVVFEIEGGTWVQGRHSQGKGFHDDCEKYNEAALCGWKLIRADSTMVMDDSFLVFLELALKE